MSSNCIVLSIHPRYVELILAGSKKIEFRKGNIPRHIGGVFIYATAPQSAIVGFFRVSSVIDLPPSELWKKYHRVGGIPRVDYDNYYQSSAVARGLIIGKVYKLPHPWRLPRNFPIPQSFVYVDHCVEFFSILPRSER